MTHESERTFHDRVVVELEQRYGAANVETDKYLQASGRYADVWVDIEPIALAIEIENDWESVATGVGQALLYAQHDARAVPVVIVPPGHVESPERELLARYLPIVEFDV